MFSQIGIVSFVVRSSSSTSEMRIAKVAGFTGPRQHSLEPDPVGWGLLDPEIT